MQLPGPEQAPASPGAWAGDAEQGRRHFTSLPGVLHAQFPLAAFEGVECQTPHWLAAAAQGDHRFDALSGAGVQHGFRLPLPSRGQPRCGETLTVVGGSGTIGADAGPLGAGCVAVPPMY